MVYLSLMMYNTLQQKTFDTWEVCTVDSLLWETELWVNNLKREIQSSQEVKKGKEILSDRDIVRKTADWFNTLNGKQIWTYEELEQKLWSYEGWKNELSTFAKTKKPTDYATYPLSDHVYHVLVLQDFFAKYDIWLHLRNSVTDQPLLLWLKKEKMLFDASFFPHVDFNNKWWHKSAVELRDIAYTSAFHQNGISHANQAVVCRDYVQNVSYNAFTKIYWEDVLSKSMYEQQVYANESLHYILRNGGNLEKQYSKYFSPSDVLFSLNNHIGDLTYNKIEEFFSQEASISVSPEIIENDVFNEIIRRVAEKKQIWWQKIYAPQKPWYEYQQDVSYRIFIEILRRRWWEKEQIFQDKMKRAEAKITSSKDFVNPLLMIETIYKPLLVPIIATLTAEEKKFIRDEYSATGSAMRNHLDSIVKKMKN